MSRKIPLLFILVLLAVAAISAGAQADTVVRLPETDIALSQSETVEVMLVCPASNCIGIDVTVAYDPDIISVEEVAPGDFLGDSPRVIVSGTDNTPGTFRFAALSSASASRPTEGVIFTIELTGAALGESDLTITSLSIFRRGGTLQASSERGLIRVTEDVESAEDEIVMPGERPTLLLSRRLTVRSGPGAEFSPSATVEPNAELEVLGISGDGAWFLVLLPGGSQGWLASSRFATLTGDIADIPIVSDFVDITADVTPETTAEEPTAAPTPSDTPEPPTPTETDTSAPIETEAIEPVLTETATEPSTPTSVPSDTPVPIGPTVTPAGATKEPAPTEETPTSEPGDTPEATTPSSSIPPTATLRTDSEAEIAPPATATPEATRTSTSAPTNTPTPTLTPSETATPTPTFTATIPEPCTVSTTSTNVPVSVGPNRVIRTTFPVNQSIRVTGQQQADDGSLWWRIEPLGGSQEADRFWVRQSDVTAQGGCDIVEEVDAPQVISGGGNSESQFSGTFRSGQNFATHSFSVTASGTYQIVCSGSPVYPEFSVGSNQSRGQTTILTNLAAGRHTLTVLASTVNAGQTIEIVSYSCSLSRR